jgi:glycosyltransferase involved in cell wall biosynthesis
MKIGIFLEGTPEAGGGFQLQVAILEGLRQIAADGDFEYVVFIAAHLSLCGLEGGMGFEVVPLERPSLPRRAGQRFLRSFRGAPVSIRRRITTQAEELIAQHRVDLVYYPSPNFLCLDHDAPYVLTVYDLQHRLQPEFPEISSRWKWTGRERYYEEAIPRAFMTVVATSALKDDVARCYGVREERVRVLPYVPGPSAHVPQGHEEAIRNKYKLPANFLFYPARFWPHKNHAGLLHALQILRDKEGVRLPLVLVGTDKGNLPYLRRLMQELRLDDQVLVLGFVPDENMAGLYRQALALTMPSFFGPTNLPPVEAFALGCPVITSDLAGAREHFGKAAVLVNPRDPGDIALGILRVYKDAALREELIRRGREVAPRWSAIQYARALVEIFQSFEPIRRCWTSR